MLAAFILATATAFAAKVPVIINVGIGPTIATVGSTSGFMAPSVGIGLQAEGWVSRRTLRSDQVRRRVPRQYRGMVRQMDDLHVRPLPSLIIPDSIFIGPLQADAPALRGATWAPISLGLSHTNKKNVPHWGLSVSPRLAWLSLRPDDGGDVVNQGWLGVSLDPELQTHMKKPIGVAVGGSVGAGWSPEVTDPALGLSGTPWILASATARLQLRFSVKIKL